MVQQAPAPAPSPAAQPAISQDDRMLAGCCHASMFVGFPVIGPLMVYAFKKDSSRFVAFHALQAAITHVSIVPLMIAGYVFGLAVTLGVGAALGENSLFFPFGIMGTWGIGFCFPWLLVMGISLYAAFRAFSGHAYRIPIVAGIVDRILDPIVPAPPPPR
jgi:uncharacterized Tic20 family protein